MLEAIGPLATDSTFALPALPTLPVLQIALAQFSSGVASTEIERQARAMELDFVQALHEGLPLCMLPHHSVQPSGNERGDYVVVDLGGSTLRIAVISVRPGTPNAPAESTEFLGSLDGYSSTLCLHQDDLQHRYNVNGKDQNLSDELDDCYQKICHSSRQDGIFLVVAKKWVISNAKKVVDENFFSLVASKLRETLEDQNVILLSDRIPVGVTWSFPLETASNNSARILLMGKGYELSNALRGADLKTVLEQAVFQNQNIRIQIEAIVNDSFAVYAAGRFFDRTTELALVLGTGFNMCYELRTSSDVHMLKILAHELQMLFNTEMSFFGVALLDLFVTKYDLAIDPRLGTRPTFLPHMSVDLATNTIFQPSELLSSGRYIVELVRLVVLDLIENREIFTNQKNYSAVLSPYEGITGTFVSKVVDITDNFELGAALLESYFNWPTGLILIDDVAKLKLMVQAVVQRSAAVVSIAIIASIKLLVRCNGPFKCKEVTIGYVGAVIEQLEMLRDSVTRFVNEANDIQGLGVRIRLRHVDESSLVGGAIAAACHLPKQKTE